ncbi:hypothetical protein G9A89_017163 [Geosiphon pyriformis]|nr:hypothetical protein G9A89_017163 [Geosiphon pyriformis]
MTQFVSIKLDSKRFYNTKHMDNTSQQCRNYIIEQARNHIIIPNQASLFYLHSMLGPNSLYLKHDESKSKIADRDELIRPDIDIHFSAASTKMFPQRPESSEQAKT